VATAGMGEMRRALAITAPCQMGVTRHVSKPSARTYIVFSFF
jgi:hypothetical protein